MTKPQQDQAPAQGEEPPASEPPEPAPEDTSWATMEEIRKADERDYERR